MCCRRSRRYSPPLRGARAEMGVRWGRGAEMGTRGGLEGVGTHASRAGAPRWAPVEGWRELARMQVGHINASRAYQWFWVRWEVCGMGSWRQAC